MTKFHLNERGVWFSPPSQGTKESDPIWICSPLKIVAITRDYDNKNHGRLLHFFDSDGKEHLIAMPMELLASDGIELRKLLLSEGLDISAEKAGRTHLISYIQSIHPDQKIRCTDQTGWHGDCYVFPHETLGKQLEEKIIFQSMNHLPNPYESSGSLIEWQDNVSRFCVDNSRMSFAVSIAFASPLLSLLGEEGGGIHYRGKSSGGKTTILRVAASVFGGKKIIGSWRATDNGLEAIAALYNDNFLCLDEIGQADPKVVGDVAYLLANGVGKTRANKLALVREKKSWKLFFLSTGEISLVDHMRSSGKKTHAGQEVRIVDLPFPTGQFGVFEYIHGFSSAEEFARMLAQNNSRFYGTAGKAFIEAVIENKQSVLDQIKKLSEQFIEENAQFGDGQVLRVLRRFALIAAVGRLATDLKITFWPEGESFWAASQCFQSWLKARGGTSSQEVKNILSQVRLFFELHGESKFSPWSLSSDEYKTINRVGFKKTDSEILHYFVFLEAFKKEICEGLDSDLATKVLIEQGWLIPDSEGKSTRAESLPGFPSTVRCYRFDGGKILSDVI